jgi:hypothetical protein
MVALFLMIPALCVLLSLVLLVVYVPSVTFRGGFVVYGLFLLVAAFCGLPLAAAIVIPVFGPDSTSAEVFSSVVVAITALLVLCSPAISFFHWTFWDFDSGNVKKFAIRYCAVTIVVASTFVWMVASIWEFSSATLWWLMLAVVTITSVWVHFAYWRRIERILLRQP